MTESRSEISWFRFVAAITALAVCAVAQWYIYKGEHWERANPAVVLGAIAAAILLGKPRDTQSVTLTTPPSTAPFGRGSGLVVSVIGVAILCWAVYVLTTSWQIALRRRCARVASRVWRSGASAWRWPKASRPVPVNAAPLLRWELVAFLVILAVGFFLRFYRYADFPPPDGFCAVEEPQSGQAAYNILIAQLAAVGVRRRPLDGRVGLQAVRYDASSACACRSCSSARSPSSRSSSWCASWCRGRRRCWRRRCSRRCRWHLIYARLAHNIFPTTFIVVVLLYLCVRVHKRGGLALYPLIGFLCAYTLYTYAGYRGTSLFVGLFFAISFFLHVYRLAARHRSGGARGGRHASSASSSPALAWRRSRPSPC